ncbi:MAG: hypothetical protein ACYC6W_10955 [Nitrosotalea sp.]
MAEMREVTFIVKNKTNTCIIVDSTEYCQEPDNPYQDIQIAGGVSLVMIVLLTGFFLLMKFTQIR